MAQPQRPSPAIPPITFQRPVCPECKASMTLVSIEAERPGVDLQRFQCALCNDVLMIRAAYEDPMRSKSLGRWLQGDLHPPR
ncbi:transposase-like protein [Bradyrhizobium sp. GM24.11]